MKTIITYVFTIFLITVMSCDPPPSAYDYDDWDIDQSGALDEAEYIEWSKTTEYFNQWDIDEDDRIGPDEWETYVGDYYENYDYEESGNFEKWDLNNDGEISEDEFVKVSYSLWDHNHDGLIDEEEFREYSYDI